MIAHANFEGLTDREKRIAAFAYVAGMGAGSLIAQHIPSRANCAFHRYLIDLELDVQTVIGSSLQAPTMRQVKPMALHLVGMAKDLAGLAVLPALAPPAL